LYTSSNNRVIKSRRMGWVGQMARMGERRCVQGFGGENLREREYLEDITIDGRIILKWKHGMV
jgi:hypothetical protein